MNFISVQATYSQSHIALFHDSTCLESVSHTDARSSSHLIPFIQNLLQKHNLMISDLSFFSLDKGPGAFTSLRVTVTTFNGIAFSHHIPLIGIDGLDALLYDMRLSSGYHVALLNAYNNDVYYALSDEHGVIVQKGCKNIDLVLHDLKNLCLQTPIYCAGNGAILFKDAIKSQFKDQVISIEPIQETASVKTIGLLALEEFKRPHEPQYSITPFYLKTQLFATRPNITH